MYSPCAHRGTVPPPPTKSTAIGALPACNSSWSGEPCPHRPCSRLACSLMAARFQQWPRSPGNPAHTDSRRQRSGWSTDAKWHVPRNGGTRGPPGGSTLTAIAPGPGNPASHGPRSRLAGSLVAAGFQQWPPRPGNPAHTDTRQLPNGRSTDKHRTVTRCRDSRAA